jgi:hypothetical protein
VARLDSQIMSGGARRFDSLPEVVDFQTLKRLVLELPGANMKEYTESISEVWVVFDYHGYVIAINNQFGEYWFFSYDAAAPDEILEEIAFYFRRHLPRRDDTDRRVHEALATGGALAVATLGQFLLGVFDDNAEFGKRLLTFVALFVAVRVLLGKIIPVGGG